MYTVIQYSYTDWRRYTEIPLFQGKTLEEAQAYMFQGCPVVGLDTWEEQRRRSAESYIVLPGGILLTYRRGKAGQGVETWPDGLPLDILQSSNPIGFDGCECQVPYAGYAREYIYWIHHACGASDLYAVACVSQNGGMVLYPPEGEVLPFPDGIHPVCLDDARLADPKKAGKWFRAFPYTVYSVCESGDDAILYTGDDEHRARSVYDGEKEALLSRNFEIVVCKGGYYAALQ